MKKVFTLMIAFLALTFCAKAQYLLQEGFDTGVLPTGWTVVDADGDGYNWDAEYPYEGGFDTQAGDGCISSASYINTSSSSGTALTPDNWLISPAIALPAGTPHVELSFYVAGQDPSYCSENYGVYVSPTTEISDFVSVHQGTATDEYVEISVDLTEYVGQTIYIAFRHYNITDMYWLNLDEVSVFADPTDATISALPLSIAFGRTLIGETSNAQEINVIGYSITGDITATTDAPFAISADGTTYGTTATIASNGGTLYVNFTPEIEDSVNGIITLSATDATDVTIDLMGSGKDCSTAISEFPYTPDFANGFTNLCWFVNSTTSETWTTYRYNGITYASCSGLAGTIQDEELISPALDFSSHTHVIYMDMDFLANRYFSEGAGEDTLTTFTLYASTDGGNTWGTTPIWNLLDEDDFARYVSTPATIDLSSLAGNANVKLKFKYEGDLVSSQVLFGNVNIYTYDEPFVEANQDSLSFITILGETAEDMVIVNFVIADEATATTEAPFAVSVDGVNFANTATIANNGDTLYIQYNPTEAGNDNGNVTLSVTDGEDFVIALTGRAIDCSTEGTVPFTETFEYAGELPTCYTFAYNSQDVDESNLITSDSENGNYAVVFSSYNHNNDSISGEYMISPEIIYNGTTDLEVSFDAKAFSSYYAETFKIGYSTTDNAVESFTWGEEFTATTSYQQYIANVPATAKYIGIYYTSDYKYYLYVDNFSVKEAEPIIRVNVDTIDFGTIYLGNTSDQIAIATGVMLNEDITVSTNAPFLVSADNETFATTATLPSAGDTLYVRFEPTEEGDFVDIVTLSADGIDTTFAVKGTGYDCSGTISELPYTEAFSEVFPPMCWTVGEVDNMTYGTIDEEETDYVVAFGLPTYLATPEIEVNDNDMWIIFDYLTNIGAATNQCPDAFRVGFSSTDNSYESFTWGETTTIDYDMTAFEEFRAVAPAGTKYVAIEATEIGTYMDWFWEDYNYLLIDNFTIKVLEPEIIAANTDINFGAVEIGTTANRTVEILGALLTEPIVVTTAAPFAVSIDGATFDSIITMDAAGGTLYIQYAPTAEVTDNGTVVLTSDTVSTTINVTGSGMDCQPITALPWVEDFEGEVFPPKCWNIVSQSVDTWATMYDEDLMLSNCAYVPYGYDAQDEQLITPAFDFSNYSGRALKLSFDFIAGYTYIMSTDPEEQYNLVIYASTDGGNTFPSNSIYDMRRDQPAFADDEYEVTKAEIDLSSLAGQSNVKLMFNYVGFYGDVLMIDNVTIEDNTGIVENTNNSISIYPNPANTTLNVNASSTINTVEVYNLTGSKIATINGNGNNAQINVTNYANGMYFVKIITNDGTTTKKFSVAR